MTPKLKATYHKALLDEVFCAEMEKADDCFVPYIFSDEISKIAFAGIYKGWLLHKHKTEIYNAIS